MSVVILLSFLIFTLSIVFKFCINMYQELIHDIDTFKKNIDNMNSNFKTKNWIYTHEDYIYESLYD